MSFYKKGKIWFEKSKKKERNSTIQLLQSALDRHRWICPWKQSKGLHCNKNQKNIIKRKEKKTNLQLILLRILLWLIMGILMVILQLFIMCSTIKKNFDFIFAHLLFTVCATVFSFLFVNFRRNFLKYLAGAQTDYECIGRKSANVSHKSYAQQ